VLVSDTDTETCRTQTHLIREVFVLHSVGTMCLGVRVLCGDLRYPAVAYGILRELAVGVRALAVIMQGSA
jgi:hypothetical protein